MERAIGDIFDYEGVTLEVIEHVGCNGCYFDNSPVELVLKGTQQ